MNLLDYTSAWVKGEVFQGKIMLLIGVVVLVAAIAIFRSDNSILRGTLIPMILMLLIFFGYGGFQTFSRPGHINKVEELHAENPSEAIKQELTKAQSDDKTYQTLKVVWVILIAVSALLYLVFSTPYLKGLSIGLVGLFLANLLLDSTLHFRLQQYLKGLELLI